MYKICKHPDELEITAVSEPVKSKRECAKKLHELTEDGVFEDWRELATLSKMADFAIVGTQDNMHYEPTMTLIEKGYNLLLEKPIA